MITNVISCHVLFYQLCTIIMMNLILLLVLITLLMDPLGVFCIVGSCNGLVCITFQNRTVFLWNPTTRKLRKLPSIGTLLDKYPLYVGNRNPVYGFGYDEFVDDYKVVLISHITFYRECQHRVVEVHALSMVEVYTLRTNSWRRIGDCPYDLVGSGKFASGALHGTAIVEAKDIILSLDLVKQTYGEVSQPDYGDIHFYYLTMDVLGGCVCMLCKYYGFGADLWVMKEYGIRESWTKLIAIHDDTHQLYDEFFTPRCILKNGDILMEAVRTRLVRYNPKDGTCSHPKIHEGFPSFSVYPFSVYPYIESLVSPDTDAGAGIQWQHQYNIKENEGYDSVLRVQFGSSPGSMICTLQSLHTEGIQSYALLTWRPELVTMLSLIRHVTKTKTNL